MWQQKLASIFLNKSYVLQNILQKLILYFFFCQDADAYSFSSFQIVTGVFKKSSVRSSEYNDLNCTKCTKVGRASLGTQSCFGFRSNTVFEFPEGKSFEKCARSDSFLAIEQNIDICCMCHYRLQLCQEGIFQLLYLYQVHEGRVHYQITSCSGRGGQKFIHFSAIYAIFLADCLDEGHKCWTTSCI